jgi:hypothetical protein
MKKNMGMADRAIRTLIAIVLIILLFNGTIHGVLGTVLTIVAIVFLLTSVISFCPAYLPFGLSTRKKGPDTPA